MHQPEPEILPSARRRAIADACVLHAYYNSIRVFEQDDEMTIFIGPDRTARLLEIGVVDSDDGPLIVHSMPARNK